MPDCHKSRFFPDHPDPRFVPERSEIQYVCLDLPLEVLSRNRQPRFESGQHRELGTFRPGLCLIYKGLPWKDYPLVVRNRKSKKIEQRDKFIKLCDQKKC